LTQQKTPPLLSRPALRHPIQHQGKWITLIGDQVVGNGGTALEAREAATAARPNESSQTLFIPAAEPVSVRLPEICTRVCAVLPPNVREQTWLVGGAVRAALMGRAIEDIDYVVAGDALAAARTVADALLADYFPLDTERGVGRVLLSSENGLMLDFAQMHPDGITADLLGRDFTINAMALPMTGAMHVLDPSGGQMHLRDQVVCMVTDTALSADPIRVVRAVRLAVELSFRIERGTRVALRKHVPELAQVSIERMRGELLRCLGGPNPAGALRVLDRLGVLQRVLPASDASGAEKALAVCSALQALLSVLRLRHDVDAASEFALGLVATRVGRFRNELHPYLSDCIVATRSRRQLLYLGVLLRFYFTAAQARENCRALRFSNAECDLLAAMVQSETLPEAERAEGSINNGRNAAAPVALTGRAIHNFFNAQTQAGVEVCLLSLAETLAAKGPELSQWEWAQKVDTVVALLDGYFKRFAEVIEPPKLIDGRELMHALRIPPGERVGAILSEISAAQASGEVINREQAIQLARTLHTESG